MTFRHSGTKIMTRYQILCYRDHFDAFKSIANEKICAIPAEPQDDFAILVCVSSDRMIGFDSSEDSDKLLGLLFKDCFTTQGTNLAGPVEELPSHYSFNYAFKPKSDAFEHMLNDHKKFELDSKRFRVLARHGRLCIPPTPTPLTPFLTNPKRPISPELYLKLMDTCHYVAMGVISGEYGFGAFRVFSKNLDFFFNQLKQLMGDTGELIYVTPTQLPNN